uniref:Uncharacterized protein n=1 Tax=Sphingomonas sp. NS2 TaxID=908605 RepID=A0A0D4ZZ60_9SPHN|nr:hypothetical protein plasmid201_045 [Sphingomonas sp. NS2]
MQLLIVGGPTSVLTCHALSTSAAPATPIALRTPLDNRDRRYAMA